MEEYSKYKCWCGGKLMYLETTDGDPEGIRHDLRCIKCGQKWGMTKAAMYEIGPPKYTSKKKVTKLPDESVIRNAYNDYVRLTGDRSRIHAWNAGVRWILKYLADNEN